MKKKIAGLVMALVMVFAAGAAFGDELVRPIEAVFNSGISINVDGQSIKGDEPGAIVYNDRTYVPARALSEALKANVTWDDASQTVSVDSFSTIDFAKFKPIAEKYILNPYNTKGSLESSAQVRLLNFDLQSLPSMGFKVSETGNAEYQMITIRHPGLGAAFTTPEWMQALTDMAFSIRQDMNKNWTLVEETVGAQYRKENHIVTMEFIKNNYAVKATADTDRITIYVCPTRDYIYNKVNSGNVG